MKKDTSERGITPEFDQFMDQLYGPLLKHSKAFPFNQHIGVDTLAGMYSSSQEGFAGKAEDMLKQFGSSMSQEAVRLASALVWIGRHGHDKRPNTDFVEVGTQRAIVHQDRVLKGINLNFAAKEAGGKTELAGISMDETYSSVSIFKLDASASTQRPVWRLDTAILNIDGPEGDRLQYVATLKEGETNPILGTEFKLDVTPQFPSSQFSVSASWSDRIRPNRPNDERTLGLDSVKNIRSGSGKFLVDVAKTSMSTTYNYSIRRTANPWTSKGISEYASEGLVPAREIMGANLQTENGESLQLLSVRTDNFAFRRAPGTFIELDEYAIDFSKGNSGKGKKETKRMEMPKVSIYVSLPNGHTKDHITSLKTGMAKVISPITELFIEAVKTDKVRTK
jgi:hypothetical protein